MNEFRTIVGGRSRGNRMVGAYPRGIEILLKKARADPAFRGQLLQDPLNAAVSISLELSERETKTLKSTPQKILETMIANTRIPKQHVRAFKTAKTAAVLALLLGSTAVVPSVASAGQEAMPEPSVELVELAEQRMAAIQDALEAFRNDHGRYPSTDEWLDTASPFGQYIAVRDLYDPWDRKFRYEAVNKGDLIINYRLESYGLDPEDTEDNIPCPIAPEDHRFD